MNNINKKGFTLIELIIVIAIIGVLASVVVLSLGDQTGTAKNAVDTGEAAQLRTVALLSAGENEGKYGNACTKIKEATGGQVVYNSIGTARLCTDEDGGWVVVWKEQQGTNSYACVGELGSVAGIIATTRSALKVTTTTNDATDKCSSVEPNNTEIDSEFGIDS